MKSLEHQHIMVNAKVYRAPVTVMARSAAA
jgi:hypothetical protein